MKSESCGQKVSHVCCVCCCFSGWCAVIRCCSCTATVSLAAATAHIQLFLHALQPTPCLSSHSYMCSACCGRADRWPAEGGRPTATTDGLFEVSHARLIRLMALLCPAELSAALQQPLSSRLAAFPTPSGPQEKAEVAAVAESLAGLLAAAAPTAAAGGGGGGAAGWAVPLLREALAGSSLEMSDAWSAALWWVAGNRRFAEFLACKADGSCVGLVVGGEWFTS